MKKKRVNKSEERENIQRGGEIEGFLKHFVMSKVLPIVHFQKLKPISQKNTFLLILIL